MRKPHLTGREFQVVQCILEGMCAKEIGVQMGIETKSVKALKHHIFLKFGIGNEWDKTVRLVWILSGGVAA